MVERSFTKSLIIENDEISEKGCEESKIYKTTKNLKKVHIIIDLKYKMINIILIVIEFSK
jgi:hypothetical protein